MRTFKFQEGFAPVLVLVIVASAVVGGTATVVASDNAKSGDVLFPVDTAIEEFRLNLAGSPEAAVELRTQFAAERVAEIEAVLQESGVDAPGLDIALANLTAHKTAIANLVSQKQELKARAKVLEDLFEQKEKQLETAFKDAKRELKTQRANLKAQLTQAKSAGDTAKADSLRAQIAQIEVKLDALEAQEEAAEEALEVEEEKLEAQFEAEEEFLEEKEEAIEKEQEKLEEEQENDDEDEDENDDDGEEKDDNEENEENKDD